MIVFDAITTLGGRVAQFDFGEGRTLRLTPVAHQVAVLGGLGVHRLEFGFTGSWTTTWPQGTQFQLFGGAWLGTSSGGRRWLGELNQVVPEMPRQFPSPMTITLSLSDEQIRRIEKSRQGEDLNVTLDLRASVSCPERRAWPAPQAQEDIRVSASEWAQKLVQIEAGAYVEVLVPVTDSERCARAAAHIREARLAVRDGRFKDAVGLARQALDTVRNAFDTLKVFKSANSKSPRDRSQDERWAVLTQAVYDLCGAAVHSDSDHAETFRWTRSDATAVVATAAGLLARLEDADESSSAP